MKMISIAGGGLAGLSLGIALRQRGVPVEIHEAGIYPRDRVCGEFISGVEEETLDSLGIKPSLQSARLLRSTAWYLGDRLVLSADLPRPAMGISRHFLDNALARRFGELGGVLCCRSRLSPQPREGLVLCAGRRPARGRWVGLKCHLHGMELEHDLEMYAGKNGYVGMARIAEDTVNLCGLFRLDRMVGGERALSGYLRKSGLDRLTDRMARCEESSSSAVAGFQLGWQERPTESLALGDALVMIPPFSGNGMSMAFEAAETALSSLESYAQGKQDWKRTILEAARSLRKRFRHRVLAAGILHPFLTSRVGQSCFAAAAMTSLIPFPYLFRLLRH